MVRVLVIHCTEKGKLPKLTQEQLREIATKVSDALKDRPKIKFNGTFVDENGVGICDWEAPSAKDVEEFIKANIGAPYDTVVEVRQVLP